MAIKLLYILLFLCVVFPAHPGANEPGKKWIRMPTAEMWVHRNVAIPDTDVYEVVASRKDIAIVRDLDQVAIVPMKPEEARWFVGSAYRADPNKKPFLVRAVYSQGGTGRFTVSLLDGDLYVHHTSLGHHMAYNQSALVVNLAVAPREVYVIATMAR